MVINRNSNLSKEINDVLKLQQNVDGSISNVAGQIIPVVDVNPKHARVCNFVKTGTVSNATTATVWTADATRDVYLVAASLNVIKDVTSTSTLSSIAVTVGGVSVNLIRIPGITLTAQNQGISLSFSSPILIDRGSSIFVQNTTNVTNISTSANIVGFTIENIGA